MKSLRFRAHILGQLRLFFNARGYLEVETPILAKHGVSDRYLSNIKALVNQQSYFLQTSPEYHMKRLLAAGSGPVFQLARVFRDDELGRWHNPEFTMCEWYQLDIDHFELISEVDILLQQVLGLAPMKKVTYQQVFMDICGIDPLSSPLACLHETLKRFGLGDVLSAEEQDRDQILFLLMSHVIEKALVNEPMPIAIFHFPPSQASLAKVNAGVAERFEVFYRGVELLNGFHELTCAVSQRARFESDNEQRVGAGLPPVVLDSYFLAALDHGLPPCSGVAMGIDRLLALALKEESIKTVLSFDFSRA